ncbi:MAG TPA: helix-turn-helix domain-containing protein [Streptosporangiaceae bacterium]|jgi:AraC-like DNA-binding protein
MTVVLRSDDVPATSRRDYFHDALAAVIGPVAARTGGGNELPDQVRAADLGAIRVGELSASRPGGADRTRRHIQATDADLCKVDVVARGEVVVEQDGRQARLRAGDFAFVDLSRPARWANTGAVQVVAVALPRKLLALRAADVAGLTAVGFTGDDGPGALFSGTARQVCRHAGSLDPAAGARVGTATLDLLTVALADRLGRRGQVPPDVGERALVLRVRAFIEDQIADPGLSPTVIARVHHVSLRYLYRLFEGEPASVAGLIKERRLERCRRDLLDRSLGRVPVSAIAARWGLPNAAHFSRAFRDAYGSPPAQYRRLCTRARPG